MNNRLFSKIVAGSLLCSMTFYTSPVFAYTKDETVYSKADASGKSYSTLVSTHLINDSKDSIINDLSDLLNVSNVNGDEKFDQNGESLIWHSNGNDIYYQGESQKTLPIECKLKYELDGKEISADEIAGKSGRVKITAEYVNKDVHSVNINGKNENLYTPFVAICGTILDNKQNRNITVSNGKVIDDGSKTIVFGMAFPGLQDSLSISKDKINLPSSVEICMDASDFECQGLISYITPKVFEDSNLDAFDDLNKIYSKVNILESSAKQLEDGASTLKSGTSTYAEKSLEFNNAMKQFSSGINSAASSYSELDKGINTLYKNSGTLEDGAKKISDGTKSVSSAISTIGSSLGKLQDGTLALQAGEKQISDGLDKIIEVINQANTVNGNSTASKDLQDLITANNTVIKNLEASNAAISSLLSAADPTTKVVLEKQQTLNASTINVLKLDNQAHKQTLDTMKNTSKQMADLQAGLTSLKNGMTSLETGTKSLYDNQSKVKSGVDTLAFNMNDLINR